MRKYVGFSQIQFNWSCLVSIILYCRLLHTSRVVFNHSDLLNKATMLLLTPNGQLITVSVPLHLLLRQVFCLEVQY